MNTRFAHGTAFVPLLTLGAALVTGVSALLTAGVNAEGAPTPSETTIVTEAPPAMPAATGQTVVDVTTTPPTGTMALVAP
jgi:hypothetical protein